MKQILPSYYLQKIKNCTNDLLYRNLILKASLFIFVSAVISCKNDFKPKEFDIEYKDSILTNIDFSYKLQYSILKNQSLSNDSALIVFNNETKDIFAITLSNHQTDKIEIQKNLLKFATSIYIEHDTCYIFEEQSKSFVKLNLKTSAFKRISSNLSNKVSYYSIFTPLEKHGNEFCIYKIPHSNLNQTDERNNYFKTNLIVSLDIGDTIIENPLPIFFPSKYINKFYNEVYPVISVLSDDSMACVFNHTDSILLYFNSKLNYIKTPTFYSSQSPEYSELMLKENSFFNDSEYTTIQPQFFKILLLKNRVVIFYKCEQSLLNSQDELNSFETADIKAIEYNIETKVFSTKKCRNDIHSQFAIRFNNSIIVPKKSNKLVLYGTNL